MKGKLKKLRKKRLYTVLKKGLFDELVFLSTRTYFLFIGKSAGVTYSIPSLITDLTL